jgi:hypothetical protein
MNVRRTKNEPRYGPPSPRMRATFSWGLHPRLYDVAPLRGLQNDAGRRHRAGLASPPEADWHLGAGPLWSWWWCSQSLIIVEIHHTVES